VKEDFAFLFVGHWLKGGIGEDRKNVGLLVRAFCETFKNKGTTNRPALVLKTSGAGFSIMDQQDILMKIRHVRAASGPNAPNVYLLHGELTKEEMNGLYNHPKVKAHVSFTKGEGFGLPLLEATQSQKPVIASGWSGHLDFLSPEESLLIGGELKQVEPGAVWDTVVIAESSWFNIDINQAAGAMFHLHKNYEKFADKAKSLARKNRESFSYNKLKERTAEVLHTLVPRFAMPIPMKLPQLKKVEPIVIQQVDPQEAQDFDAPVGPI
jgi:glycosyltransferase involved in cell wall biosynthesis